MSNLGWQHRSDRFHASIFHKASIFTRPRGDDHLACKHDEILPQLLGVFLDFSYDHANKRLIADMFGRTNDFNHSQRLCNADHEVCAVVFAIIFGGAFLGISGTAAALGAYGLWLVLGASVFGILAAVKTFESRSRPNVHLIANDRQSFWGQSQQPDGRIITQFSFRMQAANLTEDFIKLSAVRLSRPWTRARIVENLLMTRNPNRDLNTFSHENAISPRSITEASCTLILDGPVGRPGNPITAVIKVSDQFGRWHKVKFRLIDPRGPNAQ